MLRRAVFLVSNEKVYKNESKNPPQCLSDCFRNRAGSNKTETLAQARNSELVSCNSSKFYNFWLSWEGESTFNMRYQLARGDINESSSSWLLLLSAEFPQKFGLSYIMFCLNGSVGLLNMLPKAIGTQGKYNDFLITMRIMSYRMYAT